MTPLRERMLRDMQIRNLADNTQKSYLLQVSKFAQHFRRSPDVLGPEEIRAWLVYLREERKLAPSSLFPAVGALRFLYRVTLRRPWSDEDFPLPKKPVRLPVILSLEEIATFFESIASLKHRTILMTAYAAGLRVSEAVHLKVIDIDSQRMMIRVEQGKNRKDRYVMLSPRLLEILRLYWHETRPKEWLFPGDIPGAHHPVRSRAGMPDRAPAQRYPETDHPTFAAPRLCHPPTRVWCRRAQDPAVDGSSQPGHHRSLPEGCHQHRVRHGQSLRSAAAPRSLRARSPCAHVLLNTYAHATRGGGHLPSLWPAVPADPCRQPQSCTAARDERDRAVPYRRARRTCRAVRCVRPSTNRVQLVSPSLLSKVPVARARTLARAPAGRATSRS